MRNWQNRWTIFWYISWFNFAIFSDSESPTTGSSQEGIKLKRQLTRGSSEKLMLVNRFKKVSGIYWNDNQISSKLSRVLSQIYFCILWPRNLTFRASAFWPQDYILRGIQTFNFLSEHSPDRGHWRPKLSLRRKSMSMDESIFKE